MPERPDRHFALEPDALERYVLGSMEPMEQRACDEHVHTCAECAEAVRAERVLTAGVKRFGREDLKRRLEARLKAAPQFSVPWPRILAAAAVVMTVLGIGYLNGWFQTRQDQVPVVETTGGEPELKRSSESEDRNRLRVDKEVPGEQPLVSNRTAEPSPLGVGAGNARHEQLPDQIKIEVKKAEPVAKAGGEQAMITDARMAESAGTIRMPVQVWTNGDIRYEDEGKGEKAGEERIKVLPKDRLGMQAPAAPTVVPGEVAMKSGSAVSYVVEQRAIKDLPEAQQCRWAIADNRIPVLLEEVGGAIRIVLYFDPPLNSSTLQAARVVEVGSDSLVVGLSGRSIALEIPPSIRATRSRR